MLAVLAIAVLHLLLPAPGAPPYRAPQVAVSPKLVALAFGSGSGIYVAASTDQGQSFSEPVKVAEPGILPLGRHRGPRVVISSGTIIVTAVAGSQRATGPHAHGLPSDGDLFAWRSKDGGRSWSKPLRINDVPAAAREGLHSLASDGRGNLFAVWLDLRAEGTQLYGAFSKDSGATWSANLLLYRSPDGSICQCCHPSAGYSKDGTLDVMWRNCVGGSRDFYIMQSKDGKRFGIPTKLGTGTWKINGCPMDGGGLTHDGSRTITLWRRESSIYVAEPGKPELKIGEGKDPAVAASHGRIYALWLDGRRLELSTDGKSEWLAESASLPTIAPLPAGGALAVWEGEGGGLSVQRLR